LLPSVLSFPELNHFPAIRLNPRNRRFNGPSTFFNGGAVCFNGDAARDGNGINSVLICIVVDEDPLGHDSGVVLRKVEG
jgi:hypothetical protein